MNILIIDDDSDVKSRFESAIELWNHKAKKNAPEDLFEMEYLGELEKAQDKIEREDLGAYDGIVIDLRFKDQIKGDQLIALLNSRLIRIPVVVYTGTPDPVEGAYIKLCKKSEQNTDDILKWLYDVKMSGVLDVIGMRGSIENRLKKIFDNFQRYSLSRWAQLGREKGIAVSQCSATRYVLMHLLDALDFDGEKVFPDEFYMRVETQDCLKTGDIVFNTENGRSIYYLVMTPACDLVIRETGVPKTEAVLLVKLVSTEEAAARTLSNKIKQWEDEKHNEEDLAHLKEIFLQTFRANKIPEFLHAIPEIKGLPAKYIAFRKAQYFPYEEVSKKFCRTGLRVAPPFLKDIQARFASYYARQGQPDIDFSLEYSENADSKC